MPIYKIVPFGKIVPIASGIFPSWPSLVHLFTSTKTTSAIDPNDKLGPTGYGDAAYVPSHGSLGYQVRFENKSDATGPARQIIVTDTLDPNLDLNTFELSDITFANQVISVPPGLDHYETTVPMNASGTNILVTVQAALDRATRQLTLTLRAIDPSTGWIPEDPLTGLLYPDDATGRGQGSISYRAAPKAGLPSGTVINNRASIVFDFNDPIDTPQVHNTLDAGTPSSHVLPLPATATADTFTVQWTGQDETGGSGIGGYDVYVSADGGPYALLVGNTTNTSTTVQGQEGHSYSFYSIATDNVGHRQATPSAAQATITLPDRTPPTWPSPSSLQASDVGPTGLRLTWTAAQDNVAVAQYRVYQGGTLLATLDATTQSYVVAGLSPNTAYQFKVEAVDAADNASTTGPSVAVTTAAAPQPPPPAGHPADPLTLYVAALYQEVLARAPDADGLGYWVQLLQSGVSRLLVAQSFWESPEHRGLQVDHLYAAYLHRTPAAAERAYWVNALLQGMSQEVAAALFLDSPEYRSTHPDDASFIAGLYHDVLGRDAAVWEVESWQPMVHSPFGPAAVALRFLTSPEEYRNLLAGDYRGYLRRTAGPLEEDFWVGLMQTRRASPASAELAMLASDEFFARHMGDRI